MKLKIRTRCVPSLLASDIGDELNPHFTLWGVCLYQDRRWECPSGLKDDDVVIVFKEATYTYKAVDGKEYMNMCDFHNTMSATDTEGFYL